MCSNHINLRNILVYFKAFMRKCWIQLGPETLAQNRRLGHEYGFVAMSL